MYLAESLHGVLVNVWSLHGGYGFCIWCHVLAESLQRTLGCHFTFCMWSLLMCIEFAFVRFCMSLHDEFAFLGIKVFLLV